jgi:hypothetical protein
MEEIKITKRELAEKEKVLFLTEEEIKNLKSWKFCSQFLNLEFKIGDIARKNGTVGILVSNPDNNKKLYFKIYPGRYYFNPEKSGIISNQTIWNCNLKSNFRCIRNWESSIHYIINECIRVFLPNKEGEMMIDMIHNFYTNKPFNLKKFKYLEFEIKNQGLREYTKNLVGEYIRSGLSKSDISYLRKNPNLLWNYVDDDEESSKILTEIIGTDMRKYPELTRTLNFGSF